MTSLSRAALASWKNGRRLSSKVFAAPFKLAAKNMGVVGSVPKWLGLCVRETGLALDRAGMFFLDKSEYRDHFSGHRQLMTVGNKHPLLSEESWVAPSASLVGDVEVGKQTSVWYGAVLSGYEGKVTLGDKSNIQDECVVTASSIGKGCTVGHGAIISNTTVGDDCLVGMKSAITGAVLESGSMVAAGSVVEPGTTVGKGQLWAGNPAVFKRDLGEKDVKQVGKSAAEYFPLALAHQKEFAQFGDRVDSEKAKGTLEEMEEYRAFWKEKMGDDVGEITASSWKLETKTWG